eukprot:jgi/Mesvir1/3664/Mv14955-RA.1
MAGGGEETVDDFHFKGEFPFAPLDDDCRLLGQLLDDVLRKHVGEDVFNRIDRIRTLASSSKKLEHVGADDAARVLQGHLEDVLSSIEQRHATPLARAFSHHLNLISMAEMYHKCVHRNLVGNKCPRQMRSRDLHLKSFGEVFERLLSRGQSPETLFETISKQRVQIVLTAHPTQVNRRTMQYKYNRIVGMGCQDVGGINPYRARNVKARQEFLDARPKEKGPAGAGHIHLASRTC